MLQYLILLIGLVDDYSTENDWCMTRTMRTIDLCDVITLSVQWEQYGSISASWASCVVLCAIHCPKEQPPWVHQHCLELQTLSCCLMACKMLHPIDRSSPPRFSSPATQGHPTGIPQAQLASQFASSVNILNGHPQDSPEGSITIVPINISHGSSFHMVEIHTISWEYFAVVPNTEGTITTSKWPYQSDMVKSSYTLCTIWHCNNWRYTSTLHQCIYIL